MEQSAWSNVNRALIRVGLWLISFLVADVCFSLFFGFFSFDAVPPYFLLILLIAWPAWCLYLPVVIGFKDAEAWRLWTILSGGVLVGPLSLVLWDAAARLHGDVNVPILGLRDPLNVLHGFGMIVAVVVGSLTTCAYICGLKILYVRVYHAKCD